MEKRKAQGGIPMPPKDGGLETRPTGHGETVDVGRHSHAAIGAINSA